MVTTFTSIDAKISDLRSLPSKGAYLYVLRCPVNDDVAYIGATRNLRQRLTRHMRCSGDYCNMVRSGFYRYRKYCNGLASWLVALDQRGMRPLVWYQQVDDAMLDEAEAEAIRQLGESYRLLNVNDNPRPHNRNGRTVTPNTWRLRDALQAIEASR